jgi:hypothetical protein
MTHCGRASGPRVGNADTHLTTGLPLSIGALRIVLLLLVMPAHAWASLPCISTDAAVADSHEVESEFGYFTLDHDQGENTFTIPNLVLNDGLRRDFEVVGECRLERAYMGDIDLVDPALSLKGVLKEGLLQEKPGLSVAVEGGPLLPSTRPGERHVGFEGIGIVSGKVVPFTLHVNLGGGVDRRDAQPFGTGGVIGEFPMQPRFRLAGEVAGESSKGGSRTTLRCSASSGSPWQHLSSRMRACGAASAAALRIGNSRPA